MAKQRIAVAIGQPHPLGAAVVRFSEMGAALQLLSRVVLARQDGYLEEDPGNEGLANTGLSCILDALGEHARAGAETLEEFIGEYEKEAA